MGNFSIISPYLKKGVFPLLLGFLALIICDFTQMTIPRLVGSVIDLLAEGDSASRTFARPIAAIFGVAVLVAVMRYVWRHLIYGFSRGLEKKLRERLYNRFVELSVSWHDENSAGNLMALATNDVEAVRLALGFGLVSLVDSLVLGSAAVTFMLSISPRLCLWSFAPLPLITVTTGYFGRRIYKRVLETQNIFGSLTEIIREHISGFKVIRAMALEDLAKSEVNGESDKYMRKNVSLSVLMGMFFPLLNLLTNLALALTLFFGGTYVIRGSISPGDFVAFLTYLALLAYPLMALGYTMGLMQQGLASLTRLSGVISATEREIHPRGENDPTLEEWMKTPDPPFPETGKNPGHDLKAEAAPARIEIAKETPAPPAEKAPAFAPPAPKKLESVEFAGVTFKYPGRNEPVLNDLSFSLSPVGVTALTGPTGSGKSTLAELLPALREPDAGLVLVNGRPSTEHSLATLRSLFVYIPQDGHVFTGTLFDNIAYGKPGASKKEALAAAETSGLPMDPEVFPLGLDTPVGEKGVTISGGQRQRVALARALMMDPPYLILDDTLSAVDAAIEEEILDRLLALRADKGTLIISHRVTSLKRAEKFLVLEKGRLGGEGTFDEILEKSKYFKRITELANLGLDNLGLEGPDPFSENREGFGARGGVKGKRRPFRPDGADRADRAERTDRPDTVEP
ncbi:MAG: ABC transporter ATP-binding protein/permease [Deltaproteobacteria bacterium]|jgi:ATP-binding cassette subfamily B protein|nr:ABC transporter ATP-binding protein/permease [Deltaproteobacteria bacterium]